MSLSKLWDVLATWAHSRPDWRPGTWHNGAFGRKATASLGEIHSKGSLSQCNVDPAPSCTADRMASIHSIGNWNCSPTILAGISKMPKRCCHAISYLSGQGWAPWAAVIRVAEAWKAQMRRQAAHTCLILSLNHTTRAENHRTRPGFGS
jgi:hypothetical protein